MMDLEVKQEGGNIDDGGENNNPVNIPEQEITQTVKEENSSGENYQEFLEEEEFDFNFSNRPQSTSSRELHSQTKVIWTLEDISSEIDLESVASGAEREVQIIDEDGEEILLRFYFNKFELATRMDERVRYLSLYVSVLKGGNRNGGGLNFTVKVDRLTESFWMHYNQMPETAVYIRTPKDRLGKLVEKYFLRYMRSPIPVDTHRGRVNRGGFQLDLEEVEDLNFGLSVTLITCKTTKVAAIKAGKQTVPRLRNEVPMVEEEAQPPSASEEVLQPPASEESSPPPASEDVTQPPEETSPAPAPKEATSLQVTKEVTPAVAKEAAPLGPKRVGRGRGQAVAKEAAPLGSKGVGRGRGRGKPRQD